MRLDRGGTSDEANLQALCVWCHQAKTTAEQTGHRYELQAGRWVKVPPDEPPSEHFLNGRALAVAIGRVYRRAGGRCELDGSNGLRCLERVVSVAAADPSSPNLAMICEHGTKSALLRAIGEADGQLGGLVACCDHHPTMVGVPLWRRDPYIADVLGALDDGWKTTHDLFVAVPDPGWRCRGVHAGGVRLPTFSSERLNRILRGLEQAGTVEREPKVGGRGVRYHWRLADRS